MAKVQTEKNHYHKYMMEIYNILKGNAAVFCGDLKVRSQQDHTFLYETEILGGFNITNEEFQFAFFEISSKDDYWY